MQNIKKKLVILGGAVVIGLAGGWLVIQQQRKAALLQSAAQYDTAVVRRMDLSDKIDATGSVETERNAAMYSPYSATVKQILAKPGATVHQGEVLLVLQLKDADLINYSAGWKSSLEQAQENLAMEQKVLQREKALYQIQGTTIDEVESAQSKIQQYQAEITEYRLKLASLSKNGVNSNNEILIKAPFDAVVSWIDVKLEETVATTDELLTLGGENVIQVKASVDQGDIDQVKVGMSATITANDQDRTLIPGTVTSFGSTGTTSSNVVTFPVVIKPLLGGNYAPPQQSGKAPFHPPAGLPKTADFKNPPSFSQNSGAPPPQPAGQSPEIPGQASAADIGNLLRAGMTVDVTISVNSHPDVLVVPLRAVFRENGRTVAKIMQKGKLIAKSIQLGYKGAKYAEVLSGLNEGDRVAVTKLEAPNSSGTESSKRNSMGGVMGGPMGGPPPGG